jgi:hypothetical protein
MQTPSVNSGLPWSESEIADIKSRVARDEPLGAIADVLSRTQTEIREKACELGLESLLNDGPAGDE